jgi:hypothetical protein
MSKTLFSMLLTLLASFACPSGRATEASQTEMRSLDEQVQEIKSDVLSIAAELDQLEERLLFPSNTQVTIFLALGEGESFRLDAVQLGIDDELAAHHIYSFKELEALQRGGVQRLFMGNLSGGTHDLEVSVLGKMSSGKDFSRVERFTFSKGIEPSLMGITLTPDSSSTPIQLKDYQVRR